MLIMKKDMGGAATCWRWHRCDGCETQGSVGVLIPAVENAVAGNAFRPLASSNRAKPHVEIGNTDAEGRWCWPTRWRSPTKTSRPLDRPRHLTGAARVRSVPIYRVLHQ